MAKAKASTKKTVEKEEVTVEEVAEVAAPKFKVGDGVIHKRTGLKFKIEHIDASGRVVHQVNNWVETGAPELNRANSKTFLMDELEAFDFDALKLKNVKKIKPPKRRA